MFTLLVVYPNSYKFSSSYFIKIPKLTPINIPTIMLNKIIKSKNIVFFL